MTEESKKGDGAELLQMTTTVVAAFVSNNAVTATQVPDLIKSVHGSLATLEGRGEGGQQTVQKPAVPIKKSITPDFVICLEDGKKLKMLKRHLRTTYGMTPEEYRAKWGLPADYPMVAPNYAKQRSNFAKKIGLGRKPGRKRRRKSAKS